jgi:uncharacterized protein YkwD
MVAFLLVGCLAVADDPAKKFEPSADERGVLAETNRERKAADLGELALNETLTRAAREYVATMAKANELGHEVGGVGFVDRHKATGYAYRAGGENVAQGQKTPAEAVETWMNSEGHKKNLLGEFTVIGIGTATAADGTQYWVQIFAAPR